MPKIIENLESRLMEEAQRQIESVGYGATTIRSVAQACGVGVGTVYNYYPSKDMLVASYMLKDWRDCIGAIQAAGNHADDPKLVAQCIYDQIRAFAIRHRSVIMDEAASAGFSSVYNRYHALLRSHLAAQFCPDDFTAEFIAESLVSWSKTEHDFEEIYSLIQKLF